MSSYGRSTTESGIGLRPVSRLEFDTSSGPTVIENSRWCPVSTRFSARISLTTINIGAFFLLSLTLFVFSVTFNFPEVLHPNSADPLIDGRVLRDDTDDVTAPPFDDVISSHLRDYAFVFTSKSHIPGVDPYKDCRIEQSASFARKRQLVLPKRNQFLISPNISKFRLGFNQSQFRFLVVITYPTTTETREKLRESVRKLENNNQYWEIKILFVILSSNEVLPENVTKESKKFNDIIVPSFSDYRMIRSLAWFSNSNEGVIDSFHFFLFVGAQDRIVSKPLLATLHKLFSQNSRLLPTTPPAIYGGLLCSDYQSAINDWKGFESAACSLDAFYCDSDLVVMSSAVAESVSDVSWNVPLNSVESRYVGLCVEVADMDLTAIVLRNYKIGSYFKAGSKKKQVDWIISI